MSLEVNKNETRNGTTGIFWGGLRNEAGIPYICRLNRPPSPPSASNPYIPHESRPNWEPPIERRDNLRVPVENCLEKSYSLRMDAALSGFPKNDLYTPGLWDPAPSESCRPPRRATGNNEEYRPPMDRETADAAKDPYNHVARDKQSGLSAALIPAPDGSLAKASVFRAGGNVAFEVTAETLKQAIQDRYHQTFVGLRGLSLAVDPEPSDVLFIGSHETLAVGVAGYDPADGQMDTMAYVAIFSLTGQLKTVVRFHRVYWHMHELLDFILRCNWESADRQPVATTDRFRLGICHSGRPVSEARNPGTGSEDAVVDLETVLGCFPVSQWAIPTRAVGNTVRGCD